MSDVPRWLRLLAGAALATLLVAVLQPAVGGLLLRTFAIGTALVIAVVAVALPLNRLAAATTTGGRRRRRAASDLPRDLGAIAASLRTMRRGEGVPENVLRPLRTSLEQRLHDHHGLTAGRPDQDVAIRRLVSGDAYALLTTAPGFAGRPLVLSRRELATLIEEIESL